MSVCGGCPYPYEMVKSGEAENEEQACGGDCTHEDAAYRISWAYEQLSDRYDSLKNEYEHLKAKYQELKGRMEDDGK